jgi:undecaprenyl-diphosphatase
VLFVAAVLVTANLALFLLIAEDVLDGGGLISHDEAILRWFVDHRSEWMVTAAKFVSTIGGFVSLMCAGVLLGVWLGRRGLHLGLAVAPAASLLIAGLASVVAKAAFGRARPPITVHQSHVTSPAFPSGHATDAAGFFLAAAFVLAITITCRPRDRVALVGAAIVLAGLVGVSRLVLGVHWFSDVVAGWTLGAAIAIATVVIAWYATTHTPKPSSTP